MSEPNLILDPVKDRHCSTNGFPVAGACGVSPGNKERPNQKKPMVRKARDLWWHEVAALSYHMLNTRKKCLPKLFY